MTKGSVDLGKWWLREVVSKGSGDLGIHAGLPCDDAKRFVMAA